MKINSSTKSKNLVTLLLPTIVFAMHCTSALAQKEKPNILVIWGDDIGQSNISAMTIQFK